MKTYQVNITGMTCMHCVMAVKKELEKIPNLSVKNVVIGKAEVAADETQVSDQLLKKAVEEAGYSVVSIQ